MQPNPPRSKTAIHMAALAAALGASGFRHTPPARLFRNPDEKQRRKSDAQAKRERRKARNLQLASNLQVKEKVHTP